MPKFVFLGRGAAHARRQGRVFLSLALFSSLCFGQAAPSRPVCPPAAWTREALLALKTGEWQMEEAGRREKLALALQDCLADPDPVLRDGIAFEGLSHWLRSRQLSAPLRLQMLEQQLLKLGATDPSGLVRPFAALLLAELARSDRIEPWLSPVLRNTVLEAATTYLSGVRDYRGFDSQMGWRHGVAHGADLLMQLALNPALEAAQLRRLALAVLSQVAPQGEHFYIYGEAERLARPLLFTARRGLLDASFWPEQLRQLAAPPAEAGAWPAALKTQAGLARLHNSRAFLQALYLMVQSHPDAKLQALLGPHVKEALAQLP